MFSLFFLLEQRNRLKMKLQMVENHFLIMLPGDQEYLYQESMQWQRNLFDYKKKKCIQLKINL